MSLYNSWAIELVHSAVVAGFLPKEDLLEVEWKARTYSKDEMGELLSGYIGYTPKSWQAIKHYIDTRF